MPDASDTPTVTTAWTTGTLAPLRHRAYAWFWLAFTVSTAGTSMQALGAQWFLVSDPGAIGLVALVQAAMTLPMALLALPAGVLADRLDRRRLLLAVQVGGLLAGLAVAVLAWQELLRPGLLLALTMVLGSAYALTLTPFQSLLPDLVSRPQVHAATALVSVAANIARVVGPAAAGLLVAQAGVPAVFAISALASAFFIVVLLRWEGVAPPPRDGQSLLLAARTGLRYVRHSPQVVRLMVRSFWFTGAMMAVLALLPLIAAQQLGLGADGYGALFASLGAGAIGGGLTVNRLRGRLSENAVVAWSFAVCAVVMAVLPLVDSPTLVMGLLIVIGFAWTWALSTMGGHLQLYLPTWVRARGLAVYSAALFSGQAIGSMVLGLVAATADLTWALWTAAITLALGVPLARYSPLVSLEGLDRTPTAHWPDPTPILPPEQLFGEVVVTVEYTVATSDVPAFVAGLPAVRRIRLRTGATQWRMLLDAETPHRFVEEYTVDSWAEHERQSRQRLVASDQYAEALVNDLSDPPPRVVRHLRLSSDHPLGSVAPQVRRPRRGRQT